MLEHIVTCTNMFINKFAGNYSNTWYVKCTNIIELKGFIGLLYMAGVLHGGRLNLDEFWERDGTGVEIFWATMSLQRFRFLIRCIRFDDLDTRIQRKVTDKFAPFREVFDLFINNCKQNYSIGEFGTIDETLVAFRGHCPFKMYIPSKPAKYGIKVFSLVDAKMSYTYNLEVYAGKQPPGSFDISNKPEDVVKRLCEPVFGTNRNIILDNWFTSYNLVQTMLTLHKLTIVGTIRKNKRELPTSFVTTKNKPVYSCTFGFQENCTIVSYIPKKNKVVILISSLHNDEKIDPESGERNKPEIITFYNSTKGGVDNVDRITTDYSVARNTNHWPLTMFFYISNISSINGGIIHNANNKINMARRAYIKNLSLSLVQESLVQRAHNKHLPTLLRQSANRLSGFKECTLVSNKGKRGRCHYCKSDSKTQYYCEDCQKWLCIKHAKFVCEECYSEVHNL